MPKRDYRLHFLVVLGLSICLVDRNARASDPADAAGSRRMPVAESVHPAARASNDVGAASPDAWMDGRSLILRRRAGTEDELDRLLAEQQRFGSPLFRQWLTPDEFGRRFGIEDADLSALIAWLEARGVHASAPPRGRGWLNVSGRVVDFERAFATRVRRYKTGGGEHLANESEITLPDRFVRLVEPGSTLGAIPPRSLLRRVSVSPGTLDRVSRGRRPSHTNPTNGHHSMAPADFATIYNVAPLYAQGITGRGVSIAVLSTSNVDLDDVRRFRSVFGLPARDVQVVLNGPDPGKNPDIEGESDLDIEWSGAVAPEADVKLVLTGGGGDTLFLSAEYAVDQNLASILSLSFASCETASARGWDNVWKQAAAQGISVFVASGDSGCACDDFSRPMGTGRNVNGLASSPYAVVVGGTQFAGDVDQPDLYWAPQDSSPSTLASALSHIPEAGWNESGGVVPEAPLLSSGGGFSTFFTKGSWQVGSGVPADPHRAMPDVALSAATHDPYLLFAGSDPTLAGVAGTSASAPSFAGIAALIQQMAGGRIGNMNPRLYELARAQYERQEFPVFHDVVEGNNSVPGVTGFECAGGYDLVTGLGSVDSAALASAWTPAAIAPCAAGPTALCLNGGRFRVAAFWKNVGTGESGSARAVPLTGDTGYFWFFTDNNIELVVKALDGRPVNGKFWLFYGALTNVEYSITVTDTTTGLTRSYFNPSGRQASVADVQAF